MPPVTVIREELPTIRYYSRKKKYIILKEVITISTYIHFTKEQREQARRVDLAAFLIAQGEKAKKSGSEYEWLDGSQKVTIRGHLWYHQYEQKGGDAVDFVRRFYNKDYAEAVEMLLNNCGSQITTSPPIEKEHKPFELPPRNDRMSRVFSYLLLTRCIDKDVLYEFVRRKMIYESADYHNAVFVGFNEQNKPKYAAFRATENKRIMGECEGSDKSYSFKLTNDNANIHLFESAIDLLSYATLVKMHGKYWQNVSMISLAGVYTPKEKIEESKIPKALVTYLKSHPYIEKIYLHLDRDYAGRLATKTLKIILPTEYPNIEIVDNPVPRGKDVNDFLLLSKGMKPVVSERRIPSERRKLDKGIAR